MSSHFDVPMGESVRILKQVLPLMSRQRVPTIPQNYAVWYDYVANRNRALSADLEERISNGFGFDAEACRTLYEKFCLAEFQASFDDIHGEVRSAVDSAVTELVSLGDHMIHFSDVLGDCGETLKESPTTEDLTQLVAELFDETSRTRARGKEVEGALLVMASELAELRDQVDRLSQDSRTDALTDIANRRAFDESVLQEMRDAHDAGVPLSLMLVDIDNFKTLNDTHGHLTGDKVLRCVAQEMERCVKGRDMIARFGGDEFAVLLPSTSLDGATLLGESIRVVIKTLDLKNDQGEPITNLTLSLGVAEYLPGEDLSTFIERADASLYLSKDKGRDCVTNQRALETL